MIKKFGLRTLAVCLIGAALALAPQPAQARGFHGGGFHGGGFRGGWGGGFRGGWGGGFRGGYGRGFYGGGLYRGGFYGRGFYPGYAGFYPRYRYGGFYPGLALGVGLGYGLGYGGYGYGGYGYPYYGGYGAPYYGNYGYAGMYGNGGCGCVSPGYNYGYGGTTVVAVPRVYSNTTTNVISATPPRPANSQLTNGQSATAAQFAYYLQNNPYRQAAIRTQPVNSGSSSVIKPSDLYRSASNTRTVDAPPAPGL